MLSTVAVGAYNILSSYNSVSSLWKNVDNAGKFSVIFGHFQFALGVVLIVEGVWKYRKNRRIAHEAVEESVEAAPTQTDEAANLIVLDDEKQIVSAETNAEKVEELV
ncbi:hypothetical protein CONPUDRAFT_168558 [Coniophora puteana RWD-64-598 SS2]|uniref:Uncharacterized protein n=1 Tax=Coniophora puteana (strain RWD-64-598) TaxID=741705 RepID=A0A5M3MCP7_CONPW|nr:uncharacterized protein CONPUDRAFT_168558 [Coniophora puteana RWD-64-598 SS2]EIW76806.1 hypothetical protein CONPUDRAFT_168558 [Coniophora puteana RWD-64-598 SS2]